MTCRVCDSVNLALIIDLGQQPWAGNFLKKNEIGQEELYPLRLMFCEACTTTQIDHTVPKQVMFANHTYRSGMTTSLIHHFTNVATDVNKTFFSTKQNKTVFDIGSNDGSQLKCYKDIGFETLGIESSKQIAQIANDLGIKTIHEFFNLDAANRISQKFDVINASGVLFHLEEIHSVLDGVCQLLDKNGVFVVQFIYLKSMIENLAFDQIYHEHLLYYTIRSLEGLLNRHGLQIFDAYKVSIHGGSVVAYVSHANKRKRTERLKNLEEEEKRANCHHISYFKNFATQVTRLKIQHLEFLNQAKKEGKIVYGLGAPVKGNTLLNYLKTGVEHLRFLVEKNEMRRDLFSPGTHIPVVIEKELTQLPDIYFVLAWNFKKEILKNNQHLLNKGVEFYFPVDLAE